MTAGGDRLVVNALASIVRLHIVAIATVAALVFGWLTTGDYPWLVALLGGADWLLINLLNRISDTEEDLANDIAGAAEVARARRGYLAAWLAAQALSLGLGVLWAVELTPWRLAVQTIGVGYSFRIVPTWRGWRRFKDLYLLKNLMSAILFVLTVFCYPLVAAGWQVRLPGGLAAVGALALFFVLFELTYEILYDLRDLDGDRRVGVPTFPVVHGPTRARQIIDGLLVVSASVLLAAVGAGLLGLREALFAAAPLVQFLFYRPRLRRGLTSADCIRLTHLGTTLLLVFLAGTRAWLALGLPENIFPGK